MRSPRNFVIGFFLSALCWCLGAAAETIQLEPSGGVYTLPVRINDSITVPFVLDSGAAEVSLPGDVFLTLLRTGTIGKTDFLGKGSYTFADGRHTESDKYKIHKMQLGTHVVVNVVANVVPVYGDPLLGQSFLSRLPDWKIDNSVHALVLGDPASPPEVTPSPWTALKFIATLQPNRQGMPGQGTANMVVDLASKTLTGTIEYSGIAPPQMAAFLSPPEKQGGNPGTLPIQLPAGAASPIDVKMQMPPAAIDGLKGGEWVLLLGTKQAPEIGGEVKPAQ